MSKRTLTLILGLALVAGVLLVIAFNPANNQPKNLQTTAPSPAASPAVPADSMLSLNPNPVTVSSSSATVDVVADTGSNSITAVQFELSYDPTMVTAVDIAPQAAGAFFQNPLVLLKTIDTKAGKISFAMGIPPTEAAKKGTGTVATITFRTVFPVSSLAGKQTQLTFLPKTLVTAEGASSSVLRESRGTTLVFTNSSSSTVPSAQ